MNRTWKTIKVILLMFSTFVLGALLTISTEVVVSSLSFNLRKFREEERLSFDDFDLPRVFENAF